MYGSRPVVLLSKTIIFFCGSGVHQKLKNYNNKEICNLQHFLYHSKITDINENENSKHLYHKIQNSKYFFSIQLFNFDIYFSSNIFRGKLSNISSDYNISIEKPF